MDKEYLVKKWLNDDLSASERLAFERLDDANINQYIITKAQNFKASNFNKIDSFEVFKDKRIPENKTVEIKSINWFKIASQIAAVFLISLGLYYTLNMNSLEVVSTQIAQKETIILPDDSRVLLNAMSQIEYDKNKWSENKTVTLNGEAFFDVTKGAKFDVVTEDGIVSVLGTEFNIKQRKGFFEVTCYEGLVSVIHGNETIKLYMRDTYRVKNNIKTKNTVTSTKPEWTNNMSVFSNVAIIDVFEELERQFNVKINSNTINTKQLFSGGFEHTNITNALTAITAPLDLGFKFESDNIVVIYDVKK